MFSPSETPKVEEKEISELIILPDISVKQIEWRIPNFLLRMPYMKTFASSFFSVSNCIWRLRLWPNQKTSENEYMSLYLKRYNSNTDYSIEYYLGIKNSFGCLEQICHGILEEECSQIVYDIKKSEFQQQSKKLVPGGILTIVCTMEIMNNPIQQITSNETKPLKLRGLDKLSANFRALFQNQESCDVTFKVKDKEFKAHRSVLIARSKVFAATFRHDTLEKKTGVITVLDCDPDSFQEFLVYLYSGELENLSVNSTLSLYYTADKYDVEDLKAFCIEYLMQCLSVENICEIAVFAEKYKETELISFVQYFFNENANKIFKNSEWKHFMRNDSDLATKLLLESVKSKESV